jgi:hypothetical protein
MIEPFDLNEDFDVFDLELKLNEVIKELNEIKSLIEPSSH